MSDTTDGAVDADAIADLGLERGDHPIEKLSADRLGRGPFARALADEILRAPASGGYVMGLTGPWGSGKTSILNMTVDAIADRAVVVQFNPWLFSGTEALLGAFFAEVGKQLEKGTPVLKDIGSKLADYGRVLSPVTALFGVKGVVDSVVASLDLLTSGPSVVERRRELREELEKLDKRLLVIVDDVDRLRPEEVRDIVRLVRLVGDFPNTVYLLAFDRHRVEECLGEGDLHRGRAYLEKIMQVAYDVPLAREPDVTSIVLQGLSDILKDVATGPFDAADWANVFTLLIRPLIATPRQARRFLESLPMTLRLIGEEIALTDVLALEAIRVSKAEMFDAIVQSADALGATDSQSGYLKGQNPAVGPLSPMVKVDQQLAQTICRWLFPAARRHFDNMHYGSDFLARWRYGRRVAHPAVLRFYLERRLPDGVVPAKCIDAIVAALDKAEKLAALLASLSPEELIDATVRVTDVVVLDALPESLAVSTVCRAALPVFLNQLPRYPSEQRGFFEITGQVALDRLAIKLLRRVESDDERADIIRAVLAETHVLSSRLNFVETAGHRPNSGCRLVDESTAHELEGSLREQLIHTSSDALAAEVDPISLSEFMAETEAGREALQAAVGDDRFMIRMLRDAQTVTRSFNVGEVALHKLPIFTWDRLVKLLGEQVLRARIADLAAKQEDGRLSPAPEEAAALELAQGYAAGWRPDSALDRRINPEAAAHDDSERARNNEGEAGTETSALNDDAE